jgi:hypothetical protein
METAAPGMATVWADTKLTMDTAAKHGTSKTTTVPDTVLLTVKTTGLRL